jgi:hypothetical protein
MATRYDHPNVIVRREQSFLGAAATAGTLGHWIPQQKMNLVAVHAHVVTAGTSDTTNAYTVRAGAVGTTSIGAITIGTATAGSRVSAAIGVTVDEGALLNCLKGNDATGVSMVSYEYEVLPDAVQT